MMHRAAPGAAAKPERDSPAPQGLGLGTGPLRSASAEGASLHPLHAAEDGAKPGHVLHGASLGPSPLAALQHAPQDAAAEGAVPQSAVADAPSVHAAGHDGASAGRGPAAGPAGPAAPVRVACGWRAGHAARQRRWPADEARREAVAPERFLGCARCEAAHYWVVVVTGPAVRQAKGM